MCVGVGETENQKQHLFSGEELRVTSATPTLECRQCTRNNSNAAEYRLEEAGVGMEKAGWREVKCEESSLKEAYQENVRGE